MREVYAKEILCLSSYLFYARKHLLTFINHAENEEKITGMHFLRTSPSVSHLPFADDSIFFVWPSPVNVKNL